MPKLPPLERNINLDGSPYYVIHTCHQQVVPLLGVCLPRTFDHIGIDLADEHKQTVGDIALLRKEATLVSMGKAYSQDLRVRVLAALDGGMSTMTAHTTFRISRSMIDDWVALRATQGPVRPKPPAPRGPQAAIADLAAFKPFAQRHRGCTLAQMAQAWEHATGRRLSRTTFSLALRKTRSCWMISHIRPFDTKWMPHFCSVLPMKRYIRAGCVQRMVADGKLHERGKHHITGIVAVRLHDQCMLINGSKRCTQLLQLVEYVKLYVVVEHHVKIEIGILVPRATP